MEYFDWSIRGSLFYICINSFYDNMTNGINAITKPLAQCNVLVDEHKSIATTFWCLNTLDILFLVSNYN